MATDAIPPSTTTNVYYNKLENLLGAYRASDYDTLAELADALPVGVDHTVVFDVDRDVEADFTLTSYASIIFLPCAMLTVKNGQTLTLHNAPGLFDNYQQIFAFESTLANDVVVTGDWREIRPEWFSAVGDADRLARVVPLLSSGMRLLVSRETPIAADYTIPEGVTLVSECAGGYISGAHTLTMNGSIDAGLWQIFGSTLAVVFGEPQEQLVVDWWQQNEVPGTTDMQVAVQNALTCAIASGIETLKFSRSTYYFANTVELGSAFDGKNIRLTGNAISGWIDSSSVSTEITGATSLDSLFLFSASSFGLEVDHLRFRGKGSINSALKFTSEGMPARPVNIHNCHFVRFSKTIRSVLVPGGTNTGIAQVNIENNVFYATGYAVFAEGDIHAIMDMRFVGNVSEQGGRIGSSDNAFGGTIYIADNLLEGQSDTINIDGSRVVVYIERNYWENNTGTDIKCTASAAHGSFVKIGSQYLYSSFNIHLDGLLVDVSDLYEEQSLLEPITFGNCRRIKMGQNRRFKRKDHSQVVFGLDIPAALSATAEFPLSGVTPTVLSAGTAWYQTPSGTSAGERFTGNGQNRGQVYDSWDSADGDVLTFCGWAFNPGETTINVGFVIWNNADVEAISSENLLTVVPGVWTPYIFSARPNSGSGTSWKPRLWGASGEIIVTDIWCYTQAHSTLGVPNEFAFYIGNTQDNANGVLTTTTTDLEDATKQINVADKYQARAAWNTTTNKYVYASGSAAGDDWLDAVGTTEHTPT